MKRMYLLSILLTSVFFIISCNKFNKMLDMDLNNMEFDGSMNWGIPLINASYNIEEILKTFGEMGFIKYDANGDYYFEYTTRYEEHFMANEFDFIPDITPVFPLSFPADEQSHLFTNNRINISTEEMKIINGIIKSGEFRLNVADVSIQGIDFKVLIESNTLFYADHTPFAVELSKNNPIKDIPTAGLIVETDDGSLVFDITLTMLNTAPVNNVIFKPQISFKNISFNEAEIEILKEQTHSYNTSSKFSTFPQIADLNAIAYAPILLFDITNTFGVTANITVLEAYLKGDTDDQSILIENNTQFTIPANFTGPIHVPNTKSEILLSSDFDSLVFKYNVTIPKGKIKIYNHSFVASTIYFNIYFDITINQAIFRDTIPFGLSGLNTLSLLDTVKMRTAFNNSIPTDFDFQILFYNSATQSLTDSLLQKPLKIKGSYDGHQVPSEIQFINITNDRIKKLQQTDKMILTLSLNTEGQHKPFNRSNVLATKLGAQIIITPKN